MSKKHLLKLPKEILNEIFTYLTIEQLLRLFMSCRKLNNLSEDNTIEYSSAIQIYKHYLKLYNENGMIKKWIQNFPEEDRSRQVHITYSIMGGLVFALIFPIIMLLIILLSPQISFEDKLKNAVNCSIIELPFATAVLLVSIFSINNLKIEYFINKHFFNIENQIFFYKKNDRNEYDLSYFDFMDFGADISKLINNIEKIEKALLDILNSIEKERVFVSRKYNILKAKSNFFKNKPLDYQNPSEIRKPQPSSLDYANVSLYRYLENKHKGSLPKLFNPK